MRLSIAPAPQLPIETYVAPTSCVADTNLTDLNAVNTILYGWAYGSTSNVSTLTAATTTVTGTTSTLGTRTGVPNYTVAPTNTNIAGANNPYNGLAQTFQITTTGSGTSLRVTSISLSNISIDTTKLTAAAFATQLSALTSLTSLSLNNITTTATGGATPYFTSIPLYTCVNTTLKSLSVTNCGLTTWVALNTIYTGLTTLIFTGNPFTAFTVSGIPTTLTTLSAQNCTFLNMSLPTFATLTALKSINLRNSNLTGSILNSYFPTAMTSILLSNNKLNSTIPSFSTFTALTSLSLDNNQLTGTISSALFPSSLQTLYLSNNQLTGSIPSFSTFTLLTNLFLDTNQFTSNISPAYIPASIVNFSISNNKLTGALPIFTAATYTALTNPNIDICTNNFFTSLSSASTGIQTVPCWQDAPTVTKTSQDGNGVIFSISSYTVTNFTTKGYIHIFKNGIWLTVTSTGTTTYTATYSTINPPRATDTYTFYLTPYNFSTITNDATAQVALIFSGATQNVTNPTTITVSLPLTAPSVTKTSQDGNGVTFSIPSYTVTGYSGTGYIHIFKNGNWLAVKSTGTTYTDTYSNSNLPGSSDVYTFYLTPYNFAAITPGTALASTSLIVSGTNQNVTNPTTITVTSTIPTLTVNLIGSYGSTIVPFDQTPDTSYYSACILPSFRIVNNANYTIDVYSKNPDLTWKSIGSIGPNGTATNSQVSVGVIDPLNGVIGLDEPVYRIDNTITFGASLTTNFRYIVHGTSVQSTATVATYTFIAAPPTVFTDTPTAANQIFIRYLAAVNEIIDGYFTCPPTTSTSAPSGYIAGDIKFYDIDPVANPSAVAFYTISGFTAPRTNVIVPYSGTINPNYNSIYVTFGNSLLAGQSGYNYNLLTPSIKQDCQSIPTPNWTSCTVQDQCGTTGTQTSSPVTLATTDLNGGYSCQQRVTDYNAANSTNLTYNAGTVSYSKTCSAPACPGDFTVTASSPSTTGFIIQITLPINNPSIPAGDSYKVVLYDSAGTSVFPVTDVTTAGLASHGYNFTNAPQSVNSSLSAGTQYTLTAKLFELSATNVSFNTGKQASFTFTVPQNCVLPAVPSGGWSVCNSSCGPGTQTQNVNIVTQQVGTGTSCSAAAVPPGVTAVVNPSGTVVTYTQSCTSAPCGTICNIGTPAAGAWNTCSAVDQCGTSGTQTQAVTATSTVSSTTSSTSCSSLVTAYNSANSGKSATYDSGTNTVTYTQSCNSIPCPQSMTIVQSATTPTTTSAAYVDISLSYASAAPSLPAGDTLQVDVTQNGGPIGVCYNITTNGTNTGVRITDTTLFVAGATYTFTGTLFEKSAVRFNTGITAQFSLIIPRDCVLPATSLGTWSACSTDNTVCASTGTAGTKTMTLPITSPAVGTGTACSATTKPSGVSSMSISGTDVTYTAACTSLVCPTVTITVSNPSTSSVTFTAATTSTFVNTYNVIITGWSGAASVTIPLTNPSSSATASFAWPAGQTYNNTGNITITATLKETIGGGAQQTTPTSLTVPSFTIPSDCVIPSLNTSTNAWYCQDSTHTKKACGPTGSFYQEATLTQASGTGQSCTNLKTTLAAPTAGITRAYITKSGSEYVTYTKTCSACPTVAVTVVYMGLNLKLISTLTNIDTNSYYIVYSGFPSATSKTTSVMSSSSTSNTYIVSDTQWHQGSTGTVTYNLYELNSSTPQATDFSVSTGSVAYIFPTDCQITPYDPTSWSVCSATLCGTSGTVTQTKSITPATTGGLGCDAVLATQNIPAGITTSINGTTITYTQACSAIACPGGLLLAVDSTYPVTLISAHIDVDFGGSGFTVQFRDSNDNVLTTSVLTPSTTNIVNVNTTSLNLTKGQNFTLKAYVYQTGFMSTSVANGTVQVHVPNDCVVTPVSDSLWGNCSTANPANCGYCTAVASTCGSLGFEYEYQSYTPADAGGSCPALPTGATIVGNEIKYSRPCSTTGCVIANPGIDSIVFTIPAVTGDTIYVSPTPFTKDVHGKVTSFTGATSFVVGAAPGLSYSTATTTYTATGLTPGQSYTYNFQNSSATYPTSATATTGVATITPTLGTIDSHNITVNVTASYISDAVTNSTSEYTLSIVSGGVATTTAHIKVPLNGQSSYTFTNNSQTGYSGNYQIIAKLYDVNFTMGDSPLATSTINITSQDCVTSTWGTCDCGTSLQTRTITSTPIYFGQACGDLQQACTPSGCDVVPEPKQCKDICWLCWFYFIMIAYLLR